MKTGSVLINCRRNALSELLLLVEVDLLRLKAETFSNTKREIYFKIVNLKLYSKANLSAILFLLKLFAYHCIPFFFLLLSICSFSF